MMLVFLAHNVMTSCTKYLYVVHIDRKHVTTDHIAINELLCIKNAGAQIRGAPSTERRAEQKSKG